MKTRILFVIENLYFGGGERAFAQIINGLDKEKFRIYVACSPCGIFPQRIKNSAELIPLDLRRGFCRAKISQLSRIMKQHEIQVVHSQGGRADFFARIAASKARVAAVVSTIAMPVEGYQVGVFKKVIYMILDRFSERFVDRFIVVSEALKKRLMERHRLAQEKIIKISNGIELQQYYQRSEWAAKIKAEFNIGPTVYLVGAIGRLVWQKGLAYFIQAIKEIDVKYSAQNIKYLVVGEGRQKEALQRQAENLGISDKVIFCSFRDDIREILSALDILVLPSVLEGQPVILLEAMATGKAVVASDIEGVNETVLDNQSGLLVRPKDPSLLAEAIVGLSRDKDKRDQMGKRARKIVEERFDIKEKIKQHEMLYQSILTKKLGAI